MADPANNLRASSRAPDREPVREPSWIDAEPWAFLFSVSGPWWTRTRVWLPAGVVLMFVLGVMSENRTTGTGSGGALIMYPNGTFGVSPGAGTTVQFEFQERTTETPIGTSTVLEFDAKLMPGGRPLTNSEVAAALTVSLQNDAKTLQKCAGLLQAIKSGQRSFERVDPMLLIVRTIRRFLFPAMLIIGIIGLVRVGRRNGMRAEDEAANKHECPRCGYSLTGLPSRVCPECGHEAMLTTDEIEAIAEGRMPPPPG